MSKSPPQPPGGGGEGEGKREGSQDSSTPGTDDTSRAPTGSVLSGTSGRSGRDSDVSYSSPSIFEFMGKGGRGATRRSSGLAGIVDQKERRAIVWTKFLLMVTLVCAVVAMTVAMFKYVRNQEINNFESEFENLARKVITVSGQNVRNQFQTVELFSTSISSMVTASNMSWPKVIIPHYSEQAARVVKMSKAFSIIFGTVVEEEERLDFEEYMRENVHDHLQDAIDYLQLNATATELEGIPDVISALNITTGEKIPETRDGPYLVNWHLYPFRTQKERIFVNNNLLALQTNRNAFATTQITKTASVSFAELVNGIRGQIFQPIFEDVEGGKLVGVIWVTTFWENFFQNILPENAVGITAVLKSSCGFESTFALDGSTAVNLGSGDQHDTKYDYLEVSGELFSIHADESVEVPKDACLDTLTLQVYPSEEFMDQYTTIEPIIFAGVVLAIFVVTLVLFLLYDWAVNQRQVKILLRMQKQDKIVADIFPEQIMTRLYDNNNSYNDGFENVDDDDNADNDNNKKSKEPIADLYLESTILYADIVGFTAWSSQREPAQVFTLLEALYNQYDRVARQYNVFKVETIGSCYIAATGVPDPDPNHALNMAKFARKCISKTSFLTKLLETKLGPDTGDLELRVGIHSGQVTAGVLRGERARFQLFGDSVNTADLLLRHGRSKMIHVSDATAQLLIAAGKSGWLKQRSASDQPQDTTSSAGVVLAGKNLMTTYWLKTHIAKRPYKTEVSMSQIREDEEAVDDDDDDDSSNRSDDPTMLDASSRRHLGYSATEKNIADGGSLSKKERLVEWNVQVLATLLKKIWASRPDPSSMNPKDRQCVIGAETSVGSSQTVLEEFQDIIALPKGKDLSSSEGRRSLDDVELSEGAMEELRHFVSCVADMYRPNAFHNFEHASHVTASVVKMLKRITDTDNAANKKALSQIQPLDGVEESMRQTSKRNLLSIADMAGHSYGITSDPLTQFAVVFCSIIHDADHPGVTNAQLVQEGTYMAKRYKDKSVAEQNSVQLVWSLLMSPEYCQLRECIYSNEEELRRFRQLIVNIVMATDICDKELGALRKNRWNLAFSEEASNNRNIDQDSDDSDRKATIVLEHLIQASDVSHTMQHWNIYLLWNERFFREMYRAYQEGRASSDPSVGWYKGEIGFFDFYIIPLAKKLGSCGVFGVSSGEYLEYAMTNRNLWEKKGEAVVAGYLRKIEEEKRAQANLAISSKGGEDGLDMV